MVTKSLTLMEAVADSTWVRSIIAIRYGMFCFFFVVDTVLFMGSVNNRGEKHGTCI